VQEGVEKTDVSGCKGESATYYAPDFIQLVPRYADRQLGAWRETKSHGPSHLAPGPVVAAR
jgi:hypothetical protein